MSDLRELYQDLIIDHGRRPRCFGELPCANRRAEGVNPLCGDHLWLALLVTDGVIQDIRFKGAGCAISVASASLMSEQLKGKTEQQAHVLFQRFRETVTGNGDAVQAQVDGLPSAAAALGKLEVLAGVKDFPSRVKCATLAWHTLQAALANRQQSVSTETET